MEPESRYRPLASTMNNFTFLWIVILASTSKTLSIITVQLRGVKRAGAFCVSRNRQSSCALVAYWNYLKHRQIFKVTDLIMRLFPFVLLYLPETKFCQSLEFSPVWNCFGVYHLHDCPLSSYDWTFMHATPHPNEHRPPIPTFVSYLGMAAWIYPFRPRREQGCAELDQASLHQ